MKKIFSGIQPTGNIHLGNYLGAIVNWVNLQNNDYFNIYCLVDLHAITVYNNPKDLYDNSLSLLSILLACGIDTNKSLLFLQSQNHNHSEIAWIFDCISRIGWLNRMTQFKDKAGKNKEQSSVGLYTYPNLMAGDILLYDTDIVPIGEDQIQHLELTRDIANKFNNDFAPIFKLPQYVLNKNVSRVMSLKDPLSKMSKSDPASYSKILLIDDADTIAKKIAKATTDSLPPPLNVKDLEDRLAIKNLYAIYSATTGLLLEEVVNKYSSSNFANFKKDLADILINLLEPIGKKSIDLLNNKDYLLFILQNGANKSMELSSVKLKQVKNSIGMIV
jgi:tryptophanyl-tRNA synthetase